MKRIILGVAAIAIAVAGSAFTSAPKKTNANRAALTYYQISATGTYQKTLPAGSCTADSEPCTLSFPNPDNLSQSAAPTTVPYPSATTEETLGVPSQIGTNNGYYH